MDNEQKPKHAFKQTRWQDYIAQISMLTFNTNPSRFVYTYKWGQESSNIKTINKATQNKRHLHVRLVQKISVVQELAIVSEEEELERNEEIQEVSLSNLPA